MSIDPSPFTLRELIWMVEARLETEWDHTASILAMIHNANCQSGKAITDPSKFNPIRSQRRKRVKTPLKTLRKMMEG